MEGQGPAAQPSFDLGSIGTLRDVAEDPNSGHMAKIMASDAGGIAQILAGFTGPKLTGTLAKVEGSINGLTAESCQAFLDEAKAGKQALAAAAEMKRLAGQINVVIHALGILLCLPHILEEGETVEYVSLGAGNTGRAFDLEANRRVAEFKFIRWQGGSETIRQNSIFKDTFELVRHPTKKRKYLYVLGTHHPLKFLKGGRSLDSVLSRHTKLKLAFDKLYGGEFSKVRDWYSAHGGAVAIVDVSPWLSELAEGLIEEPVDVDDL